MDKEQLLVLGVIQMEHYMPEAEVVVDGQVKLEQNGGEMVLVVLVVEAMVDIMVELEVIQYQLMDLLTLVEVVVVLELEKTLAIPV